MGFSRSLLQFLHPVGVAPDSGSYPRIAQIPQFPNSGKAPDSPIHFPPIRPRLLSSNQLNNDMFNHHPRMSHVELSNMLDYCLSEYGVVKFLSTRLCNMICDCPIWHSYCLCSWPNTSHRVSEWDQLATMCTEPVHHSLDSSTA